MSTHNPSKGTKVTTDPLGKQNPINESAGPVAADSLAAESAESGGTFAENRNSEPLGVLGSNSTFANKNTSGAVKLDAAPDAESRLGRSEPEPTYPDSAGGQHKGVAVEDTTSSDPQVGGQGNAAGGSGANADPAPTYVNSQNVKYGAPRDTKGNIVKEDNDLSNDPKQNASWNADVGSKDDPGRLAEQQFQHGTAGVAATVATGVPSHADTRQAGAEKEGVPYGVLGNDAKLE